MLFATFIMVNLAVKAILAVHATAFDLQGAVVDSVFPQHLFDSFLRCLNLSQGLIVYQDMGRKGNIVMRYRPEMDIVDIYDVGHVGYLLRQRFHAEPFRG
jgi:hypothetical protein